MSGKRRVSSYLSMALALALLLTPVSALAAVQPFSAAPPGGAGSGGGVGETWPWGWAVVTTSNGNPNVYEAVDQYEMLPTREQRWMEAGTYIFLAWVDKNPSINKPYLVMKKDGVTVDTLPDSVSWEDHIGAPVRNYGAPYPSFVSYATTTGVLPSSGTTMTAGSSCWFIPVNGVEIEPGAEYEFSYLRGIRSNNGMTCVIYESTSTAQMLGYIQQNTAFTYPDETDQYEAKKLDTYRFRNPYVTYDDGQPVFEDFIFKVRTYADVSAYESALTTATTLVAYADAHRGYHAGGFDPLLVDQAMSDLEDATELDISELRERLQGEVDPLTTLLEGIPTYLVPFASDVTHTVTFRDWNGSMIATEAVVQGTAATAPTSPVRAGYTFVGWDTDFDDVQSDITVTARYVYAGVTWAPVGAARYTRVAGANRYATASMAALEAFPAGAGTAVVVNGTSFADALAASPLAGAVNGPILLTTTKSLSAETASALQAMGTTKVYIVGGPMAVSPQVEQQLKSLGMTVERKAGANRYATARITADAAVALGADGTRAFLVRGDDFADALSVSALAVQAKAPVLLTPTARLDDNAAGFLRAKGTTSVYIAGGPSAVSAAAEAQAKGIVTNVVRWGGANRYETCANIISQGVPVFGAEMAEVGIASGTNYPDALAGGAVMGWRGGVLLLTDPASLSGPIRTVIVSNRPAIERVEFFGGTVALSSAVQSQVLSLLK